MPLTEPTIDIHAFFTCSPTRGQNALGSIDEALIRWAELRIKGSSKEKIVQLLTIVNLCHDWLNNDWERARFRGQNKPAVEQVRDQAWKRVEWEHYTHSKKKGGKFAATDLKSLQGYHQHEADVMNKQEYKNEHVGINSVDQILSGWSVDTTTNTKLAPQVKTAVDQFRQANQIPTDVGKMTLQQYQMIEQFIIANGIDSQFRQRYYSVDERISLMLIPDSARGLWYLKPGEPFDTTTGGFTGGQALYVVDQYGNWYVDDGVPGVINHSSICRGKPILCGGVLEAKKGILTMIINNSGHYCPSRIHFSKALGTVQKLFRIWDVIEVTVTRGQRDDVTFGGPNPAGRVSPTKFIGNSSARGNGGKSFANWP